MINLSVELSIPDDIPSGALEPVLVQSCFIVSKLIVKTKAPGSVVLGIRNVSQW